MNKRLSIILLCGLLSTTAFCQSAVSFETLYNSFHREKNVEKVKVGGLLMFLAKPFVEKYAKGVSISGVSALSLDDCSADAKLRFNELAERLKDDNYEILLKSNDKEEKTRILARIRNNVIRELIIVSMGENPSLVRIKGKISPEDVQKLLNSNNR